MKNSYLILLFVLLSNSFFGQQKEYSFINFNSKNGLASNTINAILKDKEGFMWFGTEDGLNKFDGLNFKVYRHKEGDSTSLGKGSSVMALQEDRNGNLWVGTSMTVSMYNRSLNNFTNINFSPYGWIRSLLADHTGNLWVGTYNGLYYYNTKTKKITSYKAEPTQIDRLISGVVMCVFEDSKNNIWVGTKLGLYLFNERTHTFRRFLHKEDNKNSISDNTVRTITEDKNGNLWIGTDEGGLNVMNVSNETFKCFKANKSDNTALSCNRIFKVSFDNAGKLWVGTDEGLDIFDPFTSKVQRIKKSTSSKYSALGSFIGNSIRDIYLDKAGIYWISTLQGGVNKYDNNLAFFSHKQFNPFDANGLSAGSVLSFAGTPNGDIYIGTDGGGLNVFNRQTGLIKRFSINGVKGMTSAIFSLEYVANELWVGTYLDGVYVINMTTTAIRHFEIPKTSTDKSNIPINYLKADTKGNIWIGTNGNGVYQYEKQAGKIIHFSQILPQNGIRNLSLNGYITSIDEDKQGNIWLGSNGSGVGVYNPNMKKLTIMDHRNSKLPLDKVLSVYCDRKGQLWVGVFGGGLCLFVPKTKSFIQYGEKQLLANDVIYKILEDNSGKLWVSTNKGISSFDLRLKVFKNYTYHNGIQQSTFNIGSGFKAATGEMYFGGLDGFNYFSPQHLHQNKNIPTLLITDLKIGNKSVNPIENAEISEPISVAKEIKLSYKQNFSLDFVALNYTAPQESQYSYMLDGFDKEWNHVGSTTTAVYTNLDPGIYRFKLKANSEDGSWNTPEKTIIITVNPPFWRTYYAYLFYICLVIFIFWSSRKKAIQKLQDEFNREQERREITHLIEKERSEAERKMELEQLKIKFLTNLSHELKTPLTLVTNPVESLLLSEKDDDKRNTLNLINRNAKRLLNLVNQLLDFRKIEDNELKLNLTEGDFIAVAKEIFNSFKYISDRKKIQLDFETSVNQYYTSFDKDKIERILLNLLSNAIKFTNENGSVYFHIETDFNKGIKLIIGDTGIGLPPEMSTKIFDRFFQINTNILNQGSGIGLSITQEFVTLHGGTITVESEEGMGSIFTVSLPLLKKYGVTTTNSFDAQEHLEYRDSIANNIANKEVIKIEKPIVLLVDDSEDLRSYLKENLQEKYKIVEASDGKQGWQKTLSSHPEVIVSDVNMPNMDGIEMVHKIKNDARTKHIPVILLTVLAEEIDHLKGLETGANDYLTKPFNFTLLEAKIANLLLLNHSLKSTYSKHINIENPEVAHFSEDEQFLMSVARHVEENLGNSELSIEELSSMMNMSRSTLYNKIVALTGETPVEYVRSLKLSKAAVLLEKTDMKISEIGYKVGFSNPNYFARAFKAKYNMSPTKYISLKQHNSETEN